MMLFSKNIRIRSAALLMVGAVTLSPGLYAQDTDAPLSKDILSQIEFALSGSERVASPVPDVEPAAPVEPVIEVSGPVASQPALVVADPKPQSTAELLEKLGVPVPAEDILQALQPEATEPVTLDTTTTLVTAPVALNVPVHDDEEEHVGELLPDPASFRSECAQDLALLSQRVQVYFGPGSTKLTAGARDNALMVARLAADCPGVRINVLGFTDPVGDEEVNIRVSQARADAVIRMIATYGFDTSKFTAISHTKNHGPECKHFDVVDRRVAFQIIEGFS